MNSEPTLVLYQDGPRTLVLDALRAMADDLDDRASRLLGDAKLEATVMVERARIYRDMAVKAKNSSGSNVLRVLKPQKGD